MSIKRRPNASGAEYADVKKQVAHRRVIEERIIKDSSSGKTSGQNKKGDSIDMREVFFNVEGSFGTISAGRTLSLYQRQAILQDIRQRGRIYGR